MDKIVIFLNEHVDEAEAQIKAQLDASKSN